MKSISAMRIGLVLLTVALGATGCTSTQLRYSTLAQQGTLVDLQYQAVLDNVARFQVNPCTLPYFAYAAGGTTQVTDTGKADVGLIWNPYRIVTESLGMGASRALVEGWALTAVNAPDRLAGMRCAYQTVVGCEMPGCEEVLRTFFGAQYDFYMARGWFCHGPKRKVPKNACYVSHCCDTYVWVTPEGMDGFSRFTLGILQIATLKAEESGKPKRGPESMGPEAAPALEPREMPFPSFGPQFYPQTFP